MSQTTLTYKVRKSRAILITKDAKTETLTRNYPKRCRINSSTKPAPFVAKPLTSDSLVLKENVVEKSPCKRHCLEPPASPRSVSPSKRSCLGPTTPTKRIPLACITPKKTPSKFSQLKYQSPIKTPVKLIFTPTKTPVKLIFTPTKTPLSPFKSRLLSSDSSLISPVKIIKTLNKGPKSPYKQPRVVPNPAILPISPLKFGSPCRKKLLQKKLGAGRSCSSPALKGAKKLLQSCNTPDRLIGRDSEVEELEGFLRTHISERQPGSLYVSGAPGTGKSASLTHVVDKLKAELSFTLIEINCMSHNTNKALFADIASQLACTRLTKEACKSSITAKNRKKMILIMLDEIDQLKSTNQSCLYTMFEWPALENSRLVLIGIANALDLTDRVLPRLKARVTCQPHLIHFPPYTKDQIVSILKDRLKEIPHIEDVLDNVAIQFCARKVSAITGDIRKALDICRRAIELVEQKSDSTKVTLPYVSKVIQEVYGGQIHNQLSGNTAESTLPLQQQLLLCSVAIGTCNKTTNKSDTVTFGRLHAILSKVCADRMLQCPDFAECVDMCSLLESRGLVTLKSHKDKRQQKISLRIQHMELARVMEDKTLLSTIMENAAKFTRY